MRIRTYKLGKAMTYNILVSHNGPLLNHRTMRAGGYYLLNNITVLYYMEAYTDSHYFCLLGRRSGYGSSKMHIWTGCGTKIVCGRGTGNNYITSHGLNSVTLINWISFSTICTVVSQIL